MAIPEDTGRCFIEEFLRMGWDDTAVLAVFRNPFYRGPHAVWQQCGEAAVIALLADVRRQCRLLPVQGG